MKEQQMSLHTLLKRIESLHILVVGDVMLDQYLKGTVTRQSPEADVPVLDYQQTSKHPGGAANVALNLRGLGAHVYLGSVVGADGHGLQLQAMLEQDNIDTTVLITDPERITTVKTRVMAEEKHLLRIDEEITSDLSRDTTDQLLAGIEKLVSEKRIDAILLQDYNKGVLIPPVIKAVLDLCKAHQILSFVDPKFKHFELYQGLTLLKPNLVELQAWLSTDLKLNESELRRATQQLRGQSQSEAVMVTLSEHGLCYDDGESFVWQKAADQQISDVCGAGDSVISVATLCRTLALSPLEIAYWSCLAGTLVCKFPGVTPLTRQMLATHTALT